MAGCLAFRSHATYSRFALGLNASKLARALRFFASAAFRSAGTASGGLFFAARFTLTLASLSAMARLT